VSALPTPSRLSTLSPDRSVGLAVGIDRATRRSAVVRVGSPVAACVLVLAVALLGVVHATGRPHDAGVSLAAAGVEGAGGTTPQSVVVRNGSGSPLTGELRMRSGKASSSTLLQLQPGAIRTVTISQALAAACRGVVDVHLDTPGALPESIQLPCPGGSRP
jgi:hypothetical protein